MTQPTALLACAAGERARSARSAVRGAAVAGTHDATIDLMRMLVADDDPELLAAVVEALSHDGAEVVATRSGAELIERLGDGGAFDLVVTDVSMPWMSGLQVARASRAAGHQLPILIMTSLREPWIDEQVRALGAGVRLLRKPFSFDQLHDAVRRLVAP